MFTNDFSQEVWFQKYKAPEDNCIEDTWRRVAKCLASVEEPDKRAEWEQKFYDLMRGFKFVPGGRILSNAGTNFKKTVFLNCFVDGASPPDADSIEGIYKALMRQAIILKSEGGYGMCANFMRPRGSTIRGIGAQSPGAVAFLELWDKSSETITSGSGLKPRKGEKNSIRKGAQMVTLSIEHPDIEEFIEAKRTPGRLTKFNMSVLVTDRFMQAVDNDEEWELRFPNYHDYHSLYKKYWDGSYDKWAKVVAEHGKSDKPAFIVYKTIRARDLWDKIVRSTYEYNEPGVLFIDNINSLNNLYYHEYLTSCNPCGEIPLPIYGVCLLGSLNLVHYICPEKQDWDYDKLKKDVHVAVRLLDNVNDATPYDLKETKEFLQSRRRIGLGIMGLGSALLMARIPYGNNTKCLAMLESLMRCIVNEAYRASVELAKEKGVFPLFDKEKFLAGRHVAILDDDVKKLIAKHGLRNSHLTSIQPTGNTSCLANLVSGGLEPVFMFEYVRTSIQPYAPEGLHIPKHVDWDKKQFTIEGDTEWKWIKEGRENLLATKFEGKVWKYDQQRGLVKEELIRDYGVQYLMERNMWDENAEWAVCTEKLTVQDHVATMGVLAKWVCQSISKTVNVPHDYPYEEFKDVYTRAWENGIKGITTYRAGTMSAVLSRSGTKINGKPRITKTKAPERPKELPCDVHHLTVKGEQYLVLVGMLENDPYEIFATRNGFVDRKVKSGTIVKLGRPKGVYKAILDNGLELSPINAMCSPEEDALTRMCSTALRHGADIHMVVQQLEKVKGDMTCFAKSMARTLKKYIPDGTIDGQCPECGGTLIRQEGCKKCKNCTFSACG